MDHFLFPDGDGLLGLLAVGRVTARGCRAGRQWLTCDTSAFCGTAGVFNWKETQPQVAAGADRWSGGIPAQPRLMGLEWERTPRQALFKRRF